MTYEKLVNKVHGEAVVITKLWNDSGGNRKSNKILVKGRNFFGSEITDEVWINRKFYDSLFIGNKLSAKFIYKNEK